MQTDFTEDGHSKVKTQEPQKGQEMQVSEAPPFTHSGTTLSYSLTAPADRTWRMNLGNKADHPTAWPGHPGRPAQGARSSTCHIKIGEITHSHWWVGDEDTAVPTWWQIMQQTHKDYLTWGIGDHVTWD